MADKNKNNTEPTNNANQTNLGCLEEDDEFEEFPVEGKLCRFYVFLPSHFNKSEEVC